MTVAAQFIDLSETSHEAVARQVIVQLNLAIQAPTKETYLEDRIVIRKEAERHNLDTTTLEQTLHFHEGFNLPHVTSLSAAELRRHEFPTVYVEIAASLETP